MFRASRIVRFWKCDLSVRVTKYHFRYRISNVPNLFKCLFDCFHDSRINSPDKLGIWLWLKNMAIKPQQHTHQPPLRSANRSYNRLAPRSFHRHVRFHLRVNMRGLFFNSSIRIFVYPEKTTANGINSTDKQKSTLGSTATELFPRLTNAHICICESVSCAESTLRYDSIYQDWIFMFAFFDSLFND